jgi:D-alanyl-D-alanine carboxypeptidase
MRGLGKIADTNGIKTGHTCAPESNLVTIVERGDKQMIAVIPGMDSARDARMAALGMACVGQME